MGKHSSHIRRRAGRTILPKLSKLISICTLILRKKNRVDLERLYSDPEKTRYIFALAAGPFFPAPNSCHWTIQDVKSGTVYCTIPNTETSMPPPILERCDSRSGRIRQLSGRWVAFRVPSRVGSRNGHVMHAVRRRTPKTMPTGSCTRPVDRSRPPLLR